MGKLEQGKQGPKRFKDHELEIRTIMRAVLRSKDDDQPDLKKKKNAMMLLTKKSGRDPQNGDLSCSGGDVLPCKLTIKYKRSVETPNNFNGGIDSDERWYSAT